jgi:hypothetical protein
MTYTNFLAECVNEVDKIHTEFMSKFDINSYQNWFYDHASGILTFSDEKKELNFQYYIAGTYSTAFKTWKWSWDNENILEKVKSKVNTVREFGENNLYERLTTGLIETHEDEGWEFASITCKLINGIGLYRPKTDNLLIFLIVTELLDNEKAKAEKVKYIDCDVHKKRRRAFICQHLTKESRIGFEESFESYEDMEFEYEDDDFQAWCYECEKVRQKEDGWTDKAMKYAKIKAVCEKCYFEIKISNIY